MAVARSFREGWLTSKRIDALGSDSAELFLFRLALRADKNGVYHGEPELIRAAVYPLQVSRRRLADVTRYRDQCAGAGLLRLWIAADGRPYVQVLRFRQRTPSERAVHPPPPADEAGQEELPLESARAGEGPTPKPPPEPKVNGMEGREARKRQAHTLTDEEWLAALAREHPDVDVRTELRRCVQKYPRAGRKFFEQRWLVDCEEPVSVAVLAHCRARPVAPSVPEEEGWREHLRAARAEESWARSAAAMEWSALPPQWQRQIKEEMRQYDTIR